MSVFSSILRRISVLSLLSFLVFSVAFAQNEHASEPGEQETTEKKEFNASETIIHHVLDAPVWHLWDGHYGTIYLPVIAFTKDGLKVFSSHHFYNEHHEPTQEYEGLKLEHNHIIDVKTGKAVFDLSITKNVAMLLITATLMVFIFTSVARGYKKNQGAAPKGIQSFFEPIIIFVRDEIVKPNMPHNYEKFLPYLLTLFFFVLIGNLLGLLPGAANLTGNIAVTLTLATVTFILTNLNGNKGYWSHIFWTPGVPLVMRPILMLVEVVGIFTKPISLTVRLFVAITAGHIVLLAIISLAFIFQSYAVGFAASLIVLFINLIELLVAGIQAYVFTMFTALYIGMATAEHEHH